MISPKMERQTIPFLGMNKPPNIAPKTASRYS